MFRIDNLGIIFEAPSTEYPYGRLINSNPPGSGNGSPAIAEWANDAIMGMYALLDHFGLTPSDLQEQVGNSDFVKLFQAVYPVGSFIQMATDTDPATLDIRALVCDGSTVSETTYADLFAVIGTKWNTGGEPGGEFRLPDLRGKFLRGYDAGAGVDTGRVFGGNQPDAFQGHLFYNGVADEIVSAYVYGATTNELPGVATFAMQAVTNPRTYQGLTSAPKSDGVNGTPRIASSTYPNNETAYIAIRY